MGDDHNAERLPIGLTHSEENWAVRCRSQLRTGNTVTAAQGPANPAERGQEQRKDVFIEDGNSLRVGRTQGPES